MRRYIYCLIVVCFMVGCSSIDEGQPVGIQSADVTSYTVTNGIISIPSNQFCYLTGIWGSQAHSDPDNVIIYGWDSLSGGSIELAPTYLSANAYKPEWKSTYSGSMTIAANCIPWSSFHGPNNAGYSDLMVRSISSPINYPTSVAGDQLLWDNKSACWLSTFGGLSDPYEKAWLDTVGNSYGPPNWRVNILGFPFIAGGARCAWLGRDLGATTHFSATLGHPTQSGMSTSLGICLIDGVRGNMDDGYVGLTQNNGFWGLELAGQAQEASATCFGYR